MPLELSLIWFCLNSHFCKFTFAASTDYIVKKIKEKAVSLVFVAYDRMKAKYFIIKGVNPIIKRDFFFFLSKSLTILTNEYVFK